MKLHRPRQPDTLNNRMPQDSIAATQTFDAKIPPLNSWRSLAPLFLYFSAAGIVTVMLGPLLPTFIERWHLRDAQAGTLFTSFFAGQFTGSWFAARNLRLSLVAGAALSAIACASLSLTGFHGAHLALFFCGIGLSAGLTAGNVVAGTGAASRARVLAILNVCWSLGAIACPAIVRFAGESFFLLAAGLTAASGLVLLVSMNPQRTTPAATEIPTSPKLSPAWPVILLFAVSMMLYVGCENALGGWLPSYALRHDPALKAATIAFWYWMAELAGRLLLASIAPLLSEAAIYRGSLILLLGAQVAILLAPHPDGPFLILAVVAIGVCLGPVFPLLVASLLSATGQHPRVGALFSCASLGGALIPWLTGALSTHFGSLRTGLLAPALGVVLLLLLSTGIAGRQPAAADTSHI
ncbi:MAG: MFS transporter [Acidobacteria bacterium]|nr:MFS transporter [Acidobacteriota bacterium]